MQRIYVNTPTGQIHGRHAGSEGPWLILFHESPLSSMVFEPSLPYLGTWCRVFAPDTPGYGQSDPPSEPLDIPGYAGRLLSAIHIVTEGEPFVVGGIHTGASLAVEVARQSEGLATHLVLMGLPAYEEDVRVQKLRNTPPRKPQRDGSHLLWVWDRYLELWADTPLELLHRACVDFLNVCDRYTWAYHAAFRYDPMPALMAFDKPTEFIVAEGDSLASSDLRMAEVVGARVDRLAKIPGQIPYRVPDLFTQIVMQFVTGPR